MLAVDRVPWARAQMAFILGAHVIAVPFGVAWAFMILVAERGSCAAATPTRASSRGAGRRCCRGPPHPGCWWRVLGRSRAEVNVAARFAGEHVTAFTRRTDSVAAPSIRTVEDEQSLPGLIERTLFVEYPQHDDVLELYLRAPVDSVLEREPGGDPVRCRVRSNFEAAYTDAQGAMTTGGPRWLAAIGHLCFFDVVGGALRRSDLTPTAMNNKFEIALQLFSDLDERHRAALYALRCALVHDYSLAYLPPKGASRRRIPLLRHHFQLFPDHSLGELVVFPSVPWDGIAFDTSDTKIDLGFLADLAAEVHQRVRDVYAAGHLVLSRAPEEVRSRYLFMH